MTKKHMLKIEVFAPLGSCVCDFAPFMEKIMNITSKFKDSVNIEMKSIKSPEAVKYGVQGLSVVVDGDVKLSADFDEEEFERIIREKIK
ncbi:MAG: hypothetical protein ACPLZC_06780 [Candidatus Bathyarchaeales archaeon]